MAVYSKSEVDFFGISDVGSIISIMIDCVERFGLVSIGRNMECDNSPTFYQFAQGVDAAETALNYSVALQSWFDDQAGLGFDPNPYVSVTYDGNTKVTIEANEYGWNLDLSDGSPGSENINASITFIPEVPIVTSAIPITAYANELTSFELAGDGLPEDVSPSGLFGGNGLGISGQDLSGVVEVPGGDLSVRYYQGTFDSIGTKSIDVRANTRYQGGGIIYNFIVTVTLSPIEPKNIIEFETKELNKQLYPTGRAWGYVHGSEQSGTEITRFVDGLGNPFVDGFGNAFIQTSGSEASPSKRLINAFLKSTERYYTDLLSLLSEILADNDVFDEIDASNWERVFGLLKRELTLEERKTKILLRQGYPNGEKERSTAEFMQSELQANGFDVYVQENRFPDGSGGWVVQDPDLSATLPVQLGLGEMGVSEMGGDVQGIDYTIVANYIDEELDETYFDTVFSDNEMGVGEMGVSEMDTFTGMSRDEELRFTFFIGGESYPSEVHIPYERKDEFRQLVLKLKQAHNVAFLYINWVGAPVVESYQLLETGDLQLLETDDIKLLENG